MNRFEFRTTADADEFVEAIWESVGSGVDDKIDDQAWDAVSTQVADAISEYAWDAVSDNVYEAANEAANDIVNNSGSDHVEEALSQLLSAYNGISVGSHCTIGERATALVTKVIQWHLDTSFEDGGLLAPSSTVSLLSVLEDKVETLADAASHWAETRRVVELEAKIAQLAEENGVLTNKMADLTGMVSRLQATTAGLRAKHDTPEDTLAQAEATLKHILIAVQDTRGHAVNSGEPF